MSIYDEMTAFYDSISKDDFDYENAHKYLITRDSYHFKRTNEEAVLKYFLSKRLLNSLRKRFNVPDSYIGTVIAAETIEEKNRYKASNAIFQSTFWPIVISDEYISFYTFWFSLNGGFLDANVQSLSELSGTPVLGFWRNIDNYTAVESNRIKHEIRFGDTAGSAAIFSKRKPSFDKVLHANKIAEQLGICDKLSELEEVLALPYEEVFISFGKMLGFSTWFPNELFDSKPDKVKGNLRLYRV